ncbi:MAG TPA: sigma-E factor negative regulatory protein [Caldimonas sp.]
MGTFDEEGARQALSALADGELAGADGAAACAAWSADAAARRDWHAWHLIGDVLRSEDLASDPGADLQFCVAVRARLAVEPVVLAPMQRRNVGVTGSANGPRARSGRWMFGSAAAAGFVLVAGTFAVLRTVDTPASVPLALAGGGAASTAARVPAPASAVVLAEAAPGDAVIADQRLIRDAQLDRYLVAHKQFAGTSALGVPSVFLRSATVDSASR